MSYVFYFIIMTRSSMEYLGVIGVDGVGYLYNITLLVLGVACALKSRSGTFYIVAATWAPLIVMETVSLFYAPPLGQGGRLISTQFTYPAIMFCVISICQTKADAIRILQACLVSATIPVLFAIAQIAAGGISSRDVSGTFDHPNILAIYCNEIIYSVAILGLMLRSPRSFRLRFATALATMVLFVVLLATGTRGAWIAFVVSFLFFGLMADRRVLIFLFAGGTLIFVPAVQDRLNDVLNSDSGTITMEDIQKGKIVADSYAWRNALWTEALADSENDRLIGKGVGSFFPNTFDFFPATPGIDAHSAYIQMIYEVGVVGCFAYLLTSLVPAVLFIRKIRSEPKGASMGVAFVGMYMIFSYGDNSLHYLSTNWYYWTILSVLVFLTNCGVNSFGSSRATRIA